MSEYIMSRGHSSGEDINISPIEVPTHLHGHVYPKAIMRECTLIKRIHTLESQTFLAKWRITYNSKPITSRRHDWDFVHGDYDGASDSNDHRCGTAASLEDALARIKEIENESDI